MGGALAAGLVASGHVDRADLVVVEPNEAAAAALDKLTVVAKPVACRDAIIAVKPQHVATAAAQLAAAGVERILSVAAGVTTEAIEAAAGGSQPVVRAMPNTPALVGAGAAAVAGGTHATEADVAWAADVLGAVGIVVTVDEAALDAVTGLSGSGPAYVFLVAEALTEAGVLNGLTRPVATQLAHQTLLGAAKMLAETGQSPEELRAGVTSPGGTTAAGLAVLEKRAVRAAFLDAVTAATERSRQLRDS